MKKVAKLALADNKNNYLLLTLNNHPVFGNSPDLPGGMVEDGETALEAMIREVQEEAGILIRPQDAQELYTGADYSKHDTHYSLFFARLDSQPEITLSWEHTSYEWLPLDTFTEKARLSTDTYMHMVRDILQHPR